MLFRVRFSYRVTSIIVFDTDDSLQTVYTLMVQSHEYQKIHLGEIMLKIR